MIKFILLVGGAVFLGIWAYNAILKHNSKLPAPGTTYTNAMTGGPTFAGPDIDPQTGAYVPVGNRTGTVEASAQGN